MDGSGLDGHSYGLSFATPEEGEAFASVIDNAINELNLREENIKIALQAPSIHPRAP